ncbi:hypothetical protein GCM10020218_040720 [Dactylosporangium vinaceum]
MLRTRTRALLLFAAAVTALTPATAAEAAPGVAAFLHTPGTAWWHDPVGGRLTVGVDDTVSPAALVRAVERAGGSVVREPGMLRKHIAGADPFFGATGGRCLIGFNARSLPDYYFLTSAHCVAGVGSTVYADSAHTVVLGTVATKNVSSDYALVHYTNTTVLKSSAVRLPDGTLSPITGFGSGYVGQTVSRTGASGLHTGRITALNATVNYATALSWASSAPRSAASPATAAARSSPAPPGSGSPRAAAATARAAAPRTSPRPPGRRPATASARGSAHGLTCLRAEVA